ncbi:MAG TPA: multiheme c-type cytochrome [Anaerolineales bacterium]|nr:multiheme c-type cytochrome [Anaerolineales bacterium]
MTKRIRINRPTGTFERAITWVVVSAALFLILTVGAYVLLQFIQQSENATRVPMFNLITGLGILAVGLIVIVAVYSVRKRLLQEQMPGTMMSWLKSHIYLALLAFALVFVHGSLAVFDAEISSGKVAVIVFILVVLSGVAWRIVYTVIPPAVSNTVGNLSVRDTRTKSQIVQVEMDKTLAGKSTEFRRAAADGIRTGKWKRVEANLQLPPHEQAEWNRFKHLAERARRYRRRERLQRLYAAFMQGWKWLHIPMAVVFAATILFHVKDVLNPVTSIEDHETFGLPPAQMCERCHQDIVQEWKLSMHSIAQTGPVVVAQTRMALEKHPEFGLVCNNCHAPIGTSLTKYPTLPLDEENLLRSQPNGAIIDDGITCIVCHTLPEAPTERRGMFDDFPVTRGTAFFADMFGPPLGDSPAIPNTWHNSGVGFMTDNLSSSRLCGACHNVQVDINGDGEVSIFPSSDDNLQDSDGDNQLDENELDIDDDGRLRDLVLQTTFDEWEDYVAVQQARGQPALGCVDCHMPRQQPSPLVTPKSGIPFFPNIERERQSHTFIGVDYDLTPGRYTPEELELVLHERETLLQSAATLSIDSTQVVDGRLTVSVTIRNNLVGHSLPTGFAFARQMWLEVSAKTQDGTPVCLTDVDVNGTIIGAQCASGVIDSPQSDLLTCDPVALSQVGIRPSKNNEVIVLHPDSVAPLDNCDPWLVNFQKVLTKKSLTNFIEVPYQSPTADIVKIRVRVSDDQAMDPLNSTLLVNGKLRDSATFDYVFDVSELSGDEVLITVVLHFRHLPPYFLRELNGYYPNGLTADDLLANMTVVDMAKTSAQVVIP